ncbi:MAG: single-stranded DNA-binding protein [Selenomonas artemidis]
MNCVIISGRLGDDIKKAETFNNNTVIHFPLAVRMNFKRNEDGNYPTKFFRVEAWNALADTCAEYLSKGDLVIVRGRLDTDMYLDMGEKKYSTKVVASTVEFLSKSKKETPPPVDERLAEENPLNTPPEDSLLPFAYPENDFF